MSSVSPWVFGGRKNWREFHSVCLSGSGFPSSSEPVTFGPIRARFRTMTGTDRIEHYHEFCIGAPFEIRTVNRCLALSAWFTDQRRVWSLSRYIAASEPGVATRYICLCLIVPICGGRSSVSYLRGTVESQVYPLLQSIKLLHSFNV